MSQAFELAILISLKDAASAGADRVSDRIRAMGKEGRKTLQTYQDLRNDLRKGITLGGIGVAGLAGLLKGTKVAADYEDVLSDLKLTLSELGADGQLNIAKLNNEMHQADYLANRLGNSLPGNNSDFIQMIQTLRQGGVEASAIFNGAGESVANLAVVTKQVPKDLAKDFAQFGKQFNLKPEEYTKAADLFWKVFNKSKLGSAELIEGMKYFQLRAGAPLGLEGLKGAETAARLMGAMKTKGLEGSVAGTGTSNFFSQIATKKDALAKLKKETGIDIKMFDKQGKFAGIDNAFSQMEKLRKLNPEKLMQALKSIAGDEGAAVGTAMSQMGLQGWKDYNAGLDKSVNLQQAIVETTATLNARLDALSGTLDNIKVEVFKPMMEDLKPIVSLANQGATALQEFLKENPNAAKWAVRLAAIGSTGMAAYGSIKSLVAVWRMWNLVSAVSANQGLLGWLKNIRVEADKTADSIGTKSAGRWKSAGARMGGALASGVKMAFAALVVQDVMSVIGELMDRTDQEVETRKKSRALAGLLEEREKVQREAAEGKIEPVIAGERQADLTKQIAELRTELTGATGTRSKVGTFGKTSDFYNNLMIATYGYMGARQKGVMDIPTGITAKEMLGGKVDTTPIVNAFIESLKKEKFGSPQDLTEYIKSIHKTGEYNDELTAKLYELAGQAYPQYEGALDNLTQETTSAARAFARIPSLLNFNLPVPFGSGDRRPFGPNENKPHGPILKPSKPLRMFEPPTYGPRRTMSRDVPSSEHIVPAEITKDYRAGGAGSPASGGLNNHGGIHLHVHLPAGSRAANEPEAFGEYALDFITHRVKRQLERS